MAAVRAGKPEETPGFCKAEDLANLFAASVQSINQLTRDGVLKKRETPAGKRYNVVESTRAYAQYLRDRAERRGEEDNLASRKAETAEANARIARAKARIAEAEAKWPI